MGVPFWNVLFIVKSEFYQGGNSMAVDFTNTKFTDIDLDFVKHYLRVEPDYTDDDIEIQLFIDTAKGLTMEYSEMTEDELNNVRTANLVYLRMISELYHNRSVTGDNTKIDPVFEMALRNIRKYSL